MTHPILPIEIKRSPRSRTIRLRLDSEKIIVSGPPYVAEATLLAFVEEKKDWITQSLTQKKQREEAYSLHFPDKLIPGVRLPYLGKQLLFDFVPLSEKPTLFWQTENIILTHFNAFQEQFAQDYLLQAYLNKAHELANQYFLKYCPLLGRWPTGLKMKYQKSLYGSLGANNSVHLNWLLITTPDYVFEYVVVHELSHLAYRDHGPRFWKLVEQLMPSYKEAELWLKNWGKCLKLPNWRAREESNL